MDYLLYNETISIDRQTNDSVENVLNETQVKDIFDDHVSKSSTVFDILSICLIVVYIPVFLIGLFGNGLLAVLIVFRKQLRNMTNVFLCNLAIADLAGRFQFFLRLLAISLFFDLLKYFHSPQAVQIVATGSVKRELKTWCAKFRSISA